MPDELIAPSSDSLDNATQFVGGIQWSAPEILMGEAASKASDIFSFAMVMVEGCHERFTMSQSCLLLLFINVGLQRDDTIWQYARYSGNPRHNKRETSTATDAPRPLTGVVEIDRTVLGQTSEFTAGSFIYPGELPQLVSLLFILAIAHPKD